MNAYKVRYKYKTDFSPLVPTIKSIIILAPDIEMVAREVGQRLFNQLKHETEYIDVYSIRLIGEDIVALEDI